MPNNFAVDYLFLAERERAQRLRQQLYMLHANRDLACTCAKKGAGYADDITDVEQLQLRKDLFAQLVPAEVELQATLRIGQMRKYGLAVRTPRHNAAGHAYRWALLCI